MTMRQLKCQTCGSNASIAGQICTMFAGVAAQETYECKDCFQKRMETSKLGREEERNNIQEKPTQGMEDYESECKYWESQELV